MKNTVELQKGDSVLYCPHYVTFYSKKYEGVISHISKDGKTAMCKLGFGNKNCNISDLVKLPTQPPTIW